MTRRDLFAMISGFFVGSRLPAQKPSQGLPLACDVAPLKIWPTPGDYKVAIGAPSQYCLGPSLFNPVIPYSEYIAKTTPFPYRSIREFYKDWDR